MTLKAVADTPESAIESGVESTIESGVGSTIESAIRDPQSTIRVPVDIRSAALTVLAGLAIVLVLQYAQSMIIPIVLGVLISYALEPAVAWLARRRVPRPLAAAIVLLVIVAASGWLIYGLRSQASAIVDQLPLAAKQIGRAHV